MYTSIKRSAPGKVILCGEHSVVYGRPAIAVPVSDLRAYAEVVPGTSGAGLCLRALDLDQQMRLQQAAGDHTLGRASRLVLEHLDVPEPDAVLSVHSELPIASGMGSGAAVAVAVIRALSEYLGHTLPVSVVSTLTYQVEKIHHGTPSGIDNTVVAWEKPVYFVKEQAPQAFSIAEPFHVLIANSGIAASTKEAVAEVRRRWNGAPDYYNMVFNCIGRIAEAAKQAVEQGDLLMLGALLNENHQLLVNLGISLPELDQLTQAALAAGALGAKLTGSGQGGNIIALVTSNSIPGVERALRQAGAAKIWHTQVGGHVSPEKVARDA